MSRVLPRVDRNIRALVERRMAEERRRPLQDRIADRITRFAGSLAFVMLNLVVFGAWVGMNLGWIPGPRFDQDFVKLATFASVEAIFLSTFVLITQNRMAAQADRRAELDLQVSLLAEAETTKLVALVSEIAARMEVPEAREEDIEEMKRLVQPEAVLDAIEEAETEV